MVANFGIGNDKTTQWTKLDQDPTFSSLSFIYLVVPRTSVAGRQSKVAALPYAKGHKPISLKFTITKIQFHFHRILRWTIPQNLPRVWLIS